jgi:polar amino acid transport system substrate-binding protein
VSDEPIWKYFLVINNQELKIEDVFKKVRVMVMSETNNKQVPWESSSLTGDFYFGSIDTASKPDESEFSVSTRNKSWMIKEIVSRGQLRVGFTAGYMPFEMTDNSGEFIGFDIDMAKEMAKELGVKFVPINTPWNGIIPTLIKEKFDVIISGMMITEERSEVVNFSDPYISVGQTVLLNKKHKNVVKTYRDLNYPEYIVTSKVETIGEQAVINKIPECQYRGFKSEPEAALEVVNGKADAFVYDLPFCAIFNNDVGSGNLIILDGQMTNEPLAIAIPKGDPDFITWLNHFLKQIKSDGRYDRIYNKWLHDSSWFSQLQ